MALTAGQINPANYPQPDYSGVVRSAQIQSQELANIGANIGGAIKNFGEARKEQKKVDAYNKASSKAIEAAITLGNSYDIAGVEETLRPFLDSYNDPSLSPIEKAALLDEGKAMIPNVFGRFDASEAGAIKRAQIEAAENEAKDRAAAAGRAAPSLAEFGVPGGQQKLQWNPDTKSYELPKVNLGGNNPPQQGPDLGNLPDPLKPFAEDFKTAGAKYGVAPNILAAISMHETANGTSSAFRNKNNAMGISDASGPVKLASIPESIDRMARLLGEGINKGTGPYANVKSIADIANIYAPPGANNDPRNLNQFWTQGVTSNIERLSENKTIATPQAPAQNQGAIGFVPDKQAETYRPFNEEEVALYGSQGQVSSTGRVYPIKPPTGTEFIVNPDGSVTYKQGAGVGVKAENAAKAGEQLKNESFRLNQSNTEEAFKRLDTAGTNNPVFAAGSALLAEVLPASETGELAGFYERINGENSFIKMKQQRDSSITGGAAGTMTEKEWPRYEGRFSPLKVNAKKDTIAKSLSLNLLNSFEAINGEPDQIIKALAEKKINQEEYDKYVSDYITNRQIARVNANGVEGKSNEWTKLNKNLLSKSTIYEAPANQVPFGLSPEAQDVLRRHPTTN